MSDGSRDTLGNQNTVALGKVTGSAGVALLAVLATATSLLVLHGVNAAHATVRLDQLALSGNEGGTRRLGGAGKKTTHHNGRGAKRETLDNVANVLDATVGNARNAEASGKSADTVDGGSLGPADSHDLLGDASRSTAHANAEAVSAGGDESSSLLAGDDIAANDVKVGELGLAPLDHFDLVHAVALRAVKDGNVEASLNQALETELVLGASANGSSAEELLALGKLGGQGEVLVLGQVGTRNHGDEIQALVHNRQLALLGLGKNLIGLDKGDTVGSGGEVGNHDGGNGGVGVVLELEVTVGDDTQELGAKLSVLCFQFCILASDIQGSRAVAEERLRMQRES